MKPNTNTNTNTTATSPRALNVGTIHPGDPGVQGLLRNDTFRDYVGHLDDDILSNLLTGNTHLLPRIPQASASIQRWALDDNSMLLFTDIEWKFDLEAAYPGVTAWIQDCHEQALKFRLSTPQIATNGTPVTWCSLREHLNDDCWLDWQSLRELASPLVAARLTASQRATLRLLSWEFATVLIQDILAKNDLGQMDGPHEFSFDFSEGIECLN
jgi:hypothetical protein